MDGAELTHTGRDDAAASNMPGPMGKDELLRAYGDMLLIRRFEERPASSTAWA